MIEWNCFVREVILSIKRQVSYFWVKAETIEILWVYKLWKCRARWYRKGRTRKKLFWGLIVARRKKFSSGIFILLLKATWKENTNRTILNVYTSILFPYHVTNGWLRLLNLPFFVCHIICRTFLLHLLPFFSSLRMKKKNLRKSSISRDRDNHRRTLI